MIDSGWIKLYRSMTSCKTSSRGLNFFGAMAWLVVKANYEESWYNGDKIGRGQLFVGRKYLAKEWKVGQQVVRTILSHLEDDDFLTIKSTKRGSIVTICNYDTYQMRDEDHQPSSQPTPNQPPTINQPTPNHFQEFKEDQEVQEVHQKENIKRKIFQKPSIEEVKAYCDERNNGIDAKTFVDFYEARGWMIGKNHMKDWKAAVRTWENKREQGDLFHRTPQQRKPGF